LKILKKKIHGRVRILGWSKKQHGTFSSSNLVADSKNMHTEDCLEFGLLGCYNKKIGFLNLE
jgi:hypothetical protein